MTKVKTKNNKVRVKYLVEELATKLNGNTIKRGDSEYDELRHVHNGMIDKYPTLIVRCVTTSDIAAAIGFAREQDLEIAILGGGHSPAGRAVINDGLVIDLREMKAIHVDKEKRIAVAEGGVTWGELNEATQEYGLATTGGTISGTGIAGLTLGGGFGYLQSKYGLSVDNLLSVEIVTADGQTLTVNEDENADLFWAVRGGGGNFGVVSKFTFKLHPVGPIIYGGILAYPLEDAPEVFRFYQDFTPSLPDEATLQLGMIHAPDGSGAKLIAFFGGHCGSIEEGEAMLRPVKEFGSPVMDGMGPMSYTDLNTMLDDGFPQGALNYWKSSFLETLTDDAITMLIEAFEECPAPMSGIVLEHMHGAATRVDPQATAFPHRKEGYNLLIVAQWMDPAINDSSVAWTRDSYANMEPFLDAGRYVNYLDQDDDAAAASAYGENLDRLRKVKAKYDPENVFHLNMNFKPA